MCCGLCRARPTRRSPRCAISLIKRGACPEPPKPLALSARPSAAPTANVWRGSRWKNWHCWRRSRRSTPYRRGMPNCLPPPVLPGITPACTAQSILPAPMSLVCWNGRCPESEYGFPQPRTSARRRRNSQTSAPDRAVLAHGAVGAVHLRRDVHRPGRGHRLSCPADGWTDRYGLRDPRRRRWLDDLAIGHHGTAGRAAGRLDRNTLLAQAVCRLSRAARDLVAEFPDWGRQFGGAGRRLGFAVARARTRGDAGLHGRGAEVSPGRRRALVAGIGFLRRGAHVG